jgi:hypothetical protein
MIVKFAVAVIAVVVDVTIIHFIRIWRLLLLRRQVMVLLLWLL